MSYTLTEENYLKAIYTLIQQDDQHKTSTNVLAAHLQLKPATISAMLIKLKDKRLISYEKYGKIRLTQTGAVEAIQLIRKHRIWETFLYSKLDFTWDEVHEVAEQLEHVHSDLLMDRLDKYMGYPKIDPHGDPIPDKEGKMVNTSRQLLSVAKHGIIYRVIGIKDTSKLFLQYLSDLGIGMGTHIEIISLIEFDGSLRIKVGGGDQLTVSSRFAESIWVCSHCADAKAKRNCMFEKIFKKV